MQLLRNPHNPSFKPGASFAGRLSVRHTGPPAVTPAKAGGQVLGAKRLSRILPGGTGFRVKPGMTIWGRMTIWERQTSSFHRNDVTS